MGQRRRGRCFVFLPALFAISSSLFFLDAQTLKGTILGSITDASGAVVPAAQVVITETGTNATRAAGSNDSGLYVFASLDPGVYRVDVEPGFRKVTRTNISLPPNKPGFRRSHHAQRLYGFHQRYRQPQATVRVEAVLLVQEHF